jgi:hypothetical protein
MNSGRTVFSQLIDHLPVHEFRKCVARYRGNHRTRTFSCWDQFLCLAFAQLTYRESLRDIVTCLKALKGRLYHLGIRGRVSRSTFSNANDRRDWRIYARSGRTKPADVGLGSVGTFFAPWVGRACMITSSNPRETRCDNAPVTNDRMLKTLESCRLGGYASRFMASVGAVCCGARRSSIRVEVPARGRAIARIE